MFLKGYVQIFFRVAIFQWAIQSGPEKYFLKEGWKQTSIQDAGYEEHHKFPNAIGEKSRNYVGPRCAPAPSAQKNNLLAMLVNNSAND